MKVREAEIYGFLGGLLSGVTSFPYNLEISLALGISGLTSFILGKKVIKGSSGGLVRGMGMGLTAVSLLQQLPLFL